MYIGQNLKYINIVLKIGTVGTLDSVGIRKTNHNIAIILKKH